MHRTKRLQRLDLHSELTETDLKNEEQSSIVSGNFVPLLLDVTIEMTSIYLYVT